MSLLSDCHKSSNDTATSYAGTYTVKLTLNGTWYMVKGSGSVPVDSLSSIPQSWKIENVSGNQYTISPSTDPGYVLSNTISYATIISKPSPLDNSALFSFESSGGKVNIRSVADGKYLVLQYGLNNTVIGAWSFRFDNKSPCAANYPPSFTSSGCLYDFELTQ